MRSFRIDGVSLNEFFGDSDADQQPADDHRPPAGGAMYMQRVEIQATRHAPYPADQARGAGGGGRGRGRGRPSLQRLEQRLDDVAPDRGIGNNSDDDGDEHMQMEPAAPQPVPRQIQRLMDPPQTYDDEQYQVNNDRFRFRFRPVPHPSRLHQIEAARTSDLVQQCFMCKVNGNTLGDSSVIIEGDEVSKIQSYISKMKETLTRSMLANEVYSQFNRYVRRPTNRRRRETQEPIPDWPIESIIDHLGGHKGISQSLIDEMIQIIALQMNFAADNGMYQLPADWPPDEPYEISDCRLNEKLAKVVNDSAKLIAQLIAIKPKLPTENGIQTGSASGPSDRGGSSYFDKHPEKTLY